MQSRESAAETFVLGARRSRGSDAGSIAVQIGAALREALDRIDYLGPLREYPARHYIYSGVQSAEVGKSGQMLPDVLYGRPELLLQVNEELERFGAGYELRLSSNATDDNALEDVFAIRLVDRATGTNVSLRDVGFGISQVLPVIVESILARNRLILIEQPELHLHPRLQSELANLFARSATGPLRNMFIIETHSEHLMLRIQRLIREGLDPTQVSVVYVDPSQRGTRIVPLRLDSDGAFMDPWPGGFFEEGFNELFS
jgi:predicted ATPase